jgi:hypothetical protein
MMELRHPFPGCPLCGSREETSLGTADVSQHPLYSAALPKDLAWLRCHTCGHVHTRHYWTEAGNDSRDGGRPRRFKPLAQARASGGLKFIGPDGGQPPDHLPLPANSQDSGVLFTGPRMTSTVPSTKLWGGLLPCSTGGCPAPSCLTTRRRVRDWGKA